MKLLAGVDIGNSTTEVCLAEENETGAIRFLSGGGVFTTGLKGTIHNVTGVISAISEALSKTQYKMENIDVIFINEAAPVIGGAAMDTITGTIVTESSMIGHNPKTPAGFGTAVGKTISCKNLKNAQKGEAYIVIIPGEIGYEAAAALINEYGNVNIVGAILELDEAVLVYNRLNKKIPIIDEVAAIHRVGEGILTAIEVALDGQTVWMLSNPYGIATLLGLTPDEISDIVPIAKSLIGTKSAVVMKTPWENPRVKKTVKVGRLYIKGTTDVEVDLGKGAAAVMEAMIEAGDIYDIRGESGTGIGQMLGKSTESMKDLATCADEIRIRDLFALDTFAPVKIIGAMAGETSPEKAVAVAAMVTAGRLPMEKVADELAKKTGVYTKIFGVEPVMASLGALTTPGAGLPLLVLDLGGGSTDAALMDERGTVKSVSVAGAGEMATMIIRSRLGLDDRIIAENIKKYPAAKVESLYHIRLENGDVKFYENGLDPRFFGAVVLITPEGMARVDGDIPMEKIVSVRRETKRSVFVENAKRAIKKLIGLDAGVKHVILVGGSALDFEIPDFISEAFADMGMVCGRGNIRGTEDARGAVATGLIMGYVGVQDF